MMFSAKVMSRRSTVTSTLRGMLRSRMIERRCGARSTISWASENRSSWSAMSSPISKVGAAWVVSTATWATISRSLRYAL